MKEDARSTIKKKGYGKYFLLFLILNVFYAMIEKNIPPLPLIGAFLITVIEILVSVGTFYFLTLWIIDLIRRRGGVERKEDKKTRLIVNVIFIVIFLVLLASLLPVLFNGGM